MKKYIYLIISIFGSLSLQAQTVFDANKLSSTDILGTARYMGMAGAFGALGGDATAISDNPAGLGIYRRSEISSTLSLQQLNSSASWYGQKKDNTKYNASFNNFTYILSNNYSDKIEGLLGSNWSFTYNKVKDFDRDVYINGNWANSSLTDYMLYFTNGNSQKNPNYLSSDDNYNAFDNPGVSWLSVLGWNTYLTDTVGGNYVSLLNNGEKVKPSYTLKERGQINKYTLAWSGNVNNRFFIGVSMDLYSINHTSTSYFDEAFAQNGDMSLKSVYSTSGSGLGLTLGAIVKATDALRFGFSIHSPTFYSLTDRSYSDLYANVDKTYYAETPSSGYDYDYQLQSPYQLNVSGAYVFGKKGLISAEYVYNNNTGLRLMDTDGSTSAYSLENDDAKKMLKDVNTIKLGGELRLNDIVSLRAGYAYKTASNKDNAVKYLNFNTIRTDTEYFLNNQSTNYFTFGVGFRWIDWYLDFAMAEKYEKEEFHPYPSNFTDNESMKPSSATVNSLTNNMVVTLGLRF